MKLLFLQILGLFTLALVSITVAAEQTSATDLQQDQRLTQVEQKLSNLHVPPQRSTNNAANAGGAAILFGAFCALWAQNTNRSAWLWFFLGLFFSVITVIVLLVKNSRDRQDREQRERFVGRRD